jgi:hypothetical protein
MGGGGSGRSKKNGRKKQIRLAKKDSRMCADIRESLRFAHERNERNQNASRQAELTESIESEAAASSVVASESDALVGDSDYPCNDGKRNIRSFSSIAFSHC